MLKITVQPLQGPENRFQQRNCQHLCDCASQRMKCIFFSLFELLHFFVLWRLPLGWCAVRAGCGVWVGCTRNHQNRTGSSVRVDSAWVGIVVRYLKHTHAPPPALTAHHPNGSCHNTKKYKSSKSEKITFHTLGCAIAEVLAFSLLESIPGP